MDIEKLKLESKKLEPVVIIGKNGLTEETVEHIKQVLKKHRLIKIKLLRSFVSEKADEGMNKKAIGLEIAQRCNVILVDVVGLTVSLSRK
ncbi:MAG: YhbY family RNA-binding protein [archaeon]|nr:YhbY family RNA-binding protein [Nanoarchaeota archaeon]